MLYRKTLGYLHDEYGINYMNFESRTSAMAIAMETKSELKELKNNVTYSDKDLKKDIRRNKREIKALRYASRRYK